MDQGLCFSSIQFIFGETTAKLITLDESNLTESNWTEDKSRTKKPQGISSALISSALLASPLPGSPLICSVLLFSALLSSPLLFSVLPCSTWSCPTLPCKEIKFCLWIKSRSKVETASVLNTWLAFSKPRLIDWLPMGGEAWLLYLGSRTLQRK